MCGLGLVIVGLGLYSYYVRELLASLALFSVVFFFLAVVHSVFQVAIRVDTHSAICSHSPAVSSPHTQGLELRRNVTIGCGTVHE